MAMKVTEIAGKNTRNS